MAGGWPGPSGRLGNHCGFAHCGLNRAACRQQYVFPITPSKQLHTHWRVPGHACGHRKARQRQGRGCALRQLCFVNGGKCFCAAGVFKLRKWQHARGRAEQHGRAGKEPRPVSHLGDSVAQGGHQVGQVGGIHVPRHLFGDKQRGGIAFVLQRVAGSHIRPSIAGHSARRRRASRVVRRPPPPSHRHAEPRRRCAAPPAPLARACHRGQRKGGAFFIGGEVMGDGRPGVFGVGSRHIRSASSMSSMLRASGLETAISWARRTCRRQTGCARAPAQGRHRPCSPQA